MRKNSIYSCTSNACDYPIHLYHGVGQNTVFKFHYQNTNEVRNHLMGNQWSETMIKTLFDTSEYFDGPEWVELEFTNVTE